MKLSIKPGAESRTRTGRPSVPNLLVDRQGAELRDAQWAHDGHWNPTGYRWATEALLEYLKRNQDVCE